MYCHVFYESVYVVFCISSGTRTLFVWTSRRITDVSASGCFGPDVSARAFRARTFRPGALRPAGVLAYV